MSHTHVSPSIAVFNAHFFLSLIYPLCTFVFVLSPIDKYLCYLMKQNLSSFFSLILSNGSAPSYDNSLYISHCQSWGSVLILPWCRVHGCLDWHNGWLSQQLQWTTNMMTWHRSMSSLLQAVSITTQTSSALLQKQEINWKGNTEALAMLPDSIQIDFEKYFCWFALKNVSL